MGALPFSYLGIPIHHRRLTNREWRCIEDRFEKKLSCWKGKLMSYGGRLILINSVLTSMPMFLLSFFQVPVGVRKRLDFYRSRFFWQGDDLKRKYKLAKWDIICRPKDQGGLGIENLEVKTDAFLASGYGSFLLRLMPCGPKSFAASTYRQNPCPRSQSGQLTRLSGKD